MESVVSALNKMSNDTKFDDLQQSFNGIFDTIANSLIVKRF